MSEELPLGDEETKQTLSAQPPILSLKEKVVSFVRNPYILIPVIGAITIISTSIAFDTYRSSGQKTNNITTPTNRAEGQVQKVTTIPQSVKDTPQVREYDIFGISKIRTNASVEKVTSPGKSYLLNLDSGDKVTVLIGEKTTLGKAWFEIQDGIIIRSSYDLIDQDNLTQSLKVGQKVTVSYNKKELKADKKVTVDEFILNE